MQRIKFVVALVALALLVPGFARAQVVRGYTARFTTNTNGDITLIGNTLMSCTGGGSGANSCARARDGTGNNLNNNDWNMAYVDVDGDGSTINSSTANLTVPAGATVVWAGLYWGGYSATGSRNQCRFGTPAAGYATLTATQLDAGGSAYSAYVEVTNRVVTGGTGTYRVGNVQSTTGTNQYAGWSLVVVYRLGSLPPRNLTVIDGYGEVTPTSPPIDVPVSGFLTPPAGPVQSRVGVVTYEGDRNYTGDGFALNGVTLSDAPNPATNFFNSTVSQLGADFTAKNPNYVNQLGYDSDLLVANGVLPNGATATTMRLSTNGDRYFPAVLTFATDLYAPVLEGNAFAKTVVDVDGGATLPGDQLEYTLTLRNTGNDSAMQTVVRDTLPASLTYVAGTMSVLNGPNAGAKTDAAADDQAEYVAATRTIVARLGTGATSAAGGTLSPGVQTRVRFRVRVAAPAPTGTVLANQASAAFIAAQLGTALNTRSDGDTLASGYQPTTTTVTASRILGSVFEDVNYGGGSGRSLVASAGVGRPGVRVELYDGTGAYLSAVTTSAAGLYTFDGWAPGTFTVRDVSTSVLSSRTGAVATLVPVQTWRTNAPAGTAVGDAERVGGEDPFRPDAAANTTSLTLAALTTVGATPHSVGSVVLGASDVTGVDFGYNFDVVTNVQASGQGSVRQFLVNANALGNTGLAQVGKPAGVEASIFMVPGAAARPGLRAGLANWMQAGVVRIGVPLALPAITGAATWLDGTTQTANGGDTNAGTRGTVGTVGAAGLTLAGVAAPEVELIDAAGLALGVDVQAADCAVRGVAILSFGNTIGSDAHADVRVGATAARFTLEGCVLGSRALAFADPGAAERSGGDHLRVVGAATGTVRGALIGFGLGNGIALTGGATGWTVEGSEIVTNAFGSPSLEGVSLQAGGGHMVRGNRISGNDGPGVDCTAATGACTLENNTIAGNGIGSVGTAETAGVRIGGSGHRLDRNILQGNYGAGVLLLTTATNVVLTRNLAFGNGTIANRFGSPATNQLGIDLLRAGDDPAKGTSPFVTRNDTGDGDTGANALLNFPVIESAVAGATTLTVAGWARPGSTIELFLTDADPSGFGEGQTYATTVVEGSGSDLDGSTSAYAPSINGLDQGSDNTSRFRFVVPLPPGVTPGRSLSATATIPGTGTSEFGGRVLVGGGVPVSGAVYADLDHDASRGTGENGTGVATWVKLVAVTAPATAQQVAAADLVTGAYGFTSVAEGDYTMVLDDNASTADVTPTYPAARIGTEAAPGLRPATVPGLGGLANQNFGLWHGGRVEGRVFRDDGAGAPAGVGANDGVVQAGEPGVPGVAVELRSVVPACVGGVCDSTLTDGGGAFALWFPGAAGGAVAQVVERNPANWLSVAGAAGATGGAYVRATDQVTFTAANGTIASGLLFGDVPPNAFAAAGAASVAPGGVALYPHTYTARSAGAVTFADTQAPSPSISGWGYEVVRDLDCDGVVDAGETAIGAAPIALVAGERVCLVARHTAPAGRGRRFDGAGHAHRRVRLCERRARARGGIVADRSHHGACRGRGAGAEQVRRSRQRAAGRPAHLHGHLHEPVERVGERDRDRRCHAGVHGIRGCNLRHAGHGAERLRRERAAGRRGDRPGHMDDDGLARAGRQRDRDVPGAGAVTATIPSPRSPARAAPGHAGCAPRASPAGRA